MNTLFAVTRVGFFKEELYGLFLDPESAIKAVESHHGFTALTQGGMFGHVVIEEIREGFYPYPPYKPNIRMWYMCDPESERFISLPRTPDAFKDSFRFKDL